MAALAGGLFAGRALFGFFKDSITEARESVKVFKLTQAVLKSTGGAAHVSAKQVDSLAKSLSQLSGIDDEVIQGAENVLLTFRDVRNEAGKGNDIFNQGTKAALDLSVALGTDLQGATIQVGKALNDPIKGMTALRRVGVSFTKAQIDQVKALVADNNLLGAQKVILGELTKEFGGAAAAAASPWDKMKVALKNVEEAVGKALLPTLDRFATFVATTLAPVIENKLLPALGKIGSVVGKAVQDDVKAFFNALSGPEEKNADGSVKKMADEVIALTDVLQSFADVNQRFILPVFRFFGEAFTGQNRVLNDYADTIVLIFEKTQGFAFGLVGVFIRFRQGIIDTFRAVIDTMFNVGVTASHVVRDVIGAIEAFGRFIDGFVERFRVVFQGLGAIFQGLGGVVGSVFAVIRGVIAGAVRFIVGLFTLNLPAAINGLLHIFSTLAGGIASNIGNVAKIIGGVVEVVIGTLSGIVGKVFGIGADIVNGFISGIISKAGDIIGAIKRYITDKIPEFVKNVLGIHSPSTVMFKIGSQVGEGFKLGVSTSLKDLSLASALQGFNDLSRVNVPAFDSLRPGATATPSAGIGRSFGPGSIVINTAQTDERVLARELAFRLEQESRR